MSWELGSVCRFPPGVAFYKSVYGDCSLFSGAVPFRPYPKCLAVLKSAMPVEGSSAGAGRAPHVGKEVALNPICFDFDFKAMTWLTITMIALSSWETQGDTIKSLGIVVCNGKRYPEAYQKFQGFI